MGIETALLAGLITAGATVFSSMQNRKAQKEAAAAQERIAVEERSAVEQQKKADSMVRGAGVPERAAISRATAAQGRAGNLSTLLTGPSGVPQSALNLGQSTLLGE